ETKCDMVHIGQRDTPIEEARRLAPGVGIGLSTHTPEQLERALFALPTYVAFGPIFSTSSKRNADPPVGIPGLRHAAQIVRRFHRQERVPRPIPLVAIGGIGPECVAEICPLVDAVAAISGVLPLEEVAVTHEEHWLQIA